MKSLVLLACFATLAGCGGAGTLAPARAVSSSSDGATALGRSATVQSLVAQPMGAISIVTILYDGVPMKDAPVWLRIEDQTER